MRQLKEHPIFFSSPMKSHSWHSQHCTDVCQENDRDRRCKTTLVWWWTKDTQGLKNAAVVYGTWMMSFECQYFSNEIMAACTKYLFPIQEFNRSWAQIEAVSKMTVTKDPGLYSDKYGIRKYITLLYLRFHWLGCCREWQLDRDQARRHSCLCNWALLRFGQWDIMNNHQGLLKDKMKREALCHLPASAQ